MGEQSTTRRAWESRLAAVPPALGRLAVDSEASRGGVLHPLTAPAVMPATIWRLKNTYMINGGMVISRMLVNSRL